MSFDCVLLSLLDYCSKILIHWCVLLKKLVVTGTGRGFFFLLEFLFLSVRSKSEYDKAGDGNTLDEKFCSIGQQKKFI